ncbi:hypothetical protein CBM2589_A90125 [Cupriavidus taiwanensis]|uniref:Uncharacterized protein n=1 Tax=Cupriavidus taiwanensis TaxID=164546 RepID=A0A975XFF7_9BURK|nr:hypothetical protein CBM2589_A90125 [Cupriavidus taiwanensis]
MFGEASGPRAARSPQCYCDGGEHAGPWPLREAGLRTDAYQFVTVCPIRRSLRRCGGCAFL